MGHDGIVPRSTSIGVEQRNKGADDGTAAGTARSAGPLKSLAAFVLRRNSRENAERNEPTPPCSAADPATDGGTDQTGPATDDDRTEFPPAFILSDGRRRWRLPIDARIEPSQDTVALIARLRAGRVVLVGDGDSISLVAPKGWPDSAQLRDIAHRAGEIDVFLRGLHVRRRDSREETTVVGGER